MYLFTYALLVYCLLVSRLDHVWKVGIIGGVAAVWFLLNSMLGFVLSIGISVYLIITDDIPPFSRWL